MTTKKAILLIIVLGFVALVVGPGLMATLIDINSSSAERKAAASGQIVGIVTVIPLPLFGLRGGFKCESRTKPMSLNGRASDNLCCVNCPATVNHEQASIQGPAARERAESEQQACLHMRVEASPSERSGNLWPVDRLCTKRRSRQQPQWQSL